MVFGKYATSNERLIGIDFMHPIPCTNCGNNFMRRDLNPDAPRLCNNCYKPKEKDMTKLRLILNIDKDVHINIEEECLNLGINFDEYFFKLYKSFHDSKDNLNPKDKNNDDLAENTQNQEGFSPKKQKAWKK